MIVQHLRALMRASGDKRQGQPMKILFYLPVVTPWWFENLIAPMLRALNGEAELHVMVAPLWTNTGIHQEHAQALDDVRDLHWHIVQPEEPGLFRRDGAALPGLIDAVEAIAPDLTLARAIDTATCDLFPGTVRYLMEATAPPFATPVNWLILEDRPFGHGFIPDHALARAEHCAGALADCWEVLDEKLSAPLKKDWRGMLGLPSDRPILALPLQYEVAENFFNEGSPFANGPALVETLLDHLDPAIVLAVTDHPLNERYLLRKVLRDLIADHAGRAVLCTAEDQPRGATGVLAAGADAMMIDMSKSIMLAKFCGCPIVHVGGSRMADWIRPVGLADLLPERLVGRGLPGPDRAAARRFFGWHFGMRIFNPARLTRERLLAYAAGRPSESAIEEALSTMLKRQKALLGWPTIDAEATPPVTVS
jgi:hypothetical protein